MSRRLTSKKAMRQLISGRGQRVTPQRLLLLNLLRSKGGHMDADELYSLARAKHPRISLSTVYRALRLFKQLGLVEELHFEEEHHHYEGKPHREHFHLICLECGRIVEFESPLIERLKRDMSQSQGFEIKGAEIHLNDVCPTCLAKAKRGAQPAPVG